MESFICSYRVLRLFITSNFACIYEVLFILNFLTAELQSLAGFINRILVFIYFEDYYKWRLCWTNLLFSILLNGQKISRSISSTREFKPFISSSIVLLIYGSRCVFWTTLHKCHNWNLYFANLNDSIGEDSIILLHTIGKFSQLMRHFTTWF